MPKRKRKDAEKGAVLDLLVRYTQIINRIWNIPLIAKLAMTLQMKGEINLEEYERRQLAAVGVVKQVQQETTNPEFWPVLQDGEGKAMALEMQKKLDESCGHLLEVLNQSLAAGRRFARTEDTTKPAVDNMFSADQSLQRTCAEGAIIGISLLQHYGISSEEYGHALEERGKPSQPEPDGCLVVRRIH